MSSHQTTSALEVKDKLPFFAGFNSGKLVLLLKMLFSNPREFRERLATALKWRFDNPQRPKLDHTDLNLCLRNVVSRFHLEFTTLLQEPGLVEIEGEVTALVNQARKLSAMDLLHSAHPVLAKVCYVLARCIRPTCVIETGVAFGVSSAYILKALDINGRGRLISIDRPPLGRDYQQYVGSAIPDYLKHRWQLIRGDSAIQLPRLMRKLERVDMFVHDSLHTQKHMTFEFSTVWPLMSSGSILVSDDIESNCAFLEWSRRPDVSYSAFVQEPDKKPTYGAEAPIRILPSMGIAIKA